MPFIPHLDPHTHTQYVDFIICNLIVNSWRQPLQPWASSISSSFLPVFPLPRIENFFASPLPFFLSSITSTAWFSPTLFLIAFVFPLSLPVDITRLSLLSRPSLSPIWNIWSQRPILKLPISCHLCEKARFATVKTLQFRADPIFALTGSSTIVQSFLLDRQPYLAPRDYYSTFTLAPLYMTGRSPSDLCNLCLPFSPILPFSHHSFFMGIDCPLIPVKNARPIFTLFDRCSHDDDRCSVRDQICLCSRHCKFVLRVIFV